MRGVPCHKWELELRRLHRLCARVPDALRTSINRALYAEVIRFSNQILLHVRYKPEQMLTRWRQLATRLIARALEIAMLVQKEHEMMRTRMSAERTKAVHTAV